MNVGELKRQLDKVPDCYDVHLEEAGRVFLTVEPNRVILFSDPTKDAEDVVSYGHIPPEVGDDK